MKTILSILFVCTAFYTDVGDDIASSLKYGRYQDLYKYLDEKIIVRISDKEDLLSKEQCIANLSLFFEKNPLRTFTLIQKTDLSPTAQFVYGTIDAGNNKYKLSVLIKKALIVQIRIDYFE